MWIYKYGIETWAGNLIRRMEDIGFIIWEMTSIKSVRLGLIHIQVDGLTAGLWTPGHGQSELQKRDQQQRPVESMAIEAPAFFTRLDDTNIVVRVSGQIGKTGRAGARELLATVMAQATGKERQ